MDFKTFFAPSRYKIASALVLFLFVPFIRIPCGEVCPTASILGYAYRELPAIIGIHVGYLIAGLLAAYIAGCVLVEVWSR